MFEFEDFRRDVLAKMDEWSKALMSKASSEAPIIKEEAEDLIAGWKNAFPRRREEISRIVATKLADIFSKE